MEKIEKINLLEAVKAQLKTEFVGLDGIIDEICTAFTPWFVTPEVNDRPTVISLFGMTGTGKTSVIRRLIELLDLNSKTFFFNCGNEGTDTSDKSIAEKIADFLDADESNYNIDKYSKDFIFVFDEIQHARTIDEGGAEISKPGLQTIWNLIDSGIIDLNSSDWDLHFTKSFIDDLGCFAKSHPGIPLTGCCELTDRTHVEELLSNLGYFYYDRGVPGLMGSRNPYHSGTNTELSDIDDPCKSPLRILEEQVVRVICRRMNSLGVLPSEVTSNLFKSATVDEVVSKLEVYLKKISAPKRIICSGALIFLLGNIDEAFRVEGNITPDLDPDIFYDETSKVTISDIKGALKARFRAEQIARLGNTIIKYPTLKGSDFRMIIKKEVEKILDKFYKSSGILISVTDDVIDLLYSEGVYPTQGVRPVFTTINTILTPLLSRILITIGDSPKIVTMTVKDPETGYNVPTKTLLFKIGEKRVEEVEIKMSLGELRDPSKRKTRYICSVHELGHAIVLSYLTGKVPSGIVSVSAEGGGFCTTYDPEKVKEIKTRRDIKNDVMISLAGYEAEQLIYGRENVLMGSGDDIEDAWQALSDAVYSCGYFLNIKIASIEISNSSDGIPFGASDKDMDIPTMIREEFTHLTLQVRKILQDNKILIKQAALELSKTGKMSGEKFMSYIEKYGVTLTRDRMKKAADENSYEKYLYEE